VREAKTAPLPTRAGEPAGAASRWRPRISGHGYAAIAAVCAC
jgi:hypothetical protein